MSNATAKRSEVPFAHHDRFVIGGSWVKPSTDARLDVITLATEEVYVSVAEAKEADINAAVAAARTAFDRGRWPRLSHAERANYLREISKKLAC